MRCTLIQQPNKIKQFTSHTHTHDNNERTNKSKPKPTAASERETERERERRKKNKHRQMLKQTYSKVSLCGFIAAAFFTPFLKPFVHSIYFLRSVSFLHRYFLLLFFCAIFFLFLLLLRFENINGNVRKVRCSLVCSLVYVCFYFFLSAIKSA